MERDRRIAQLSPAKRALLEQRLKQQKQEGGREVRPAAAERPGRAPLSFSQERLWFLEQLVPGSGLYHLPALLPLDVSIDPARLEASVRQIAARHGALRTRFGVEDGRPYQVIAEEVRGAVDFAVLDLHGARGAAAPSLAEALDREVWAPFDLATGPLVRVRLIRGPDGQQLLLVVMHHIVSDGWSLNIFLKELRALYEAAVRGVAAELPPPPMQYADYARAQRELLAGPRLGELLAYWRGRLDGAPPLIDLPLDRPRPARQSFCGAVHAFTVPRAQLAGMRELCRDAGVVPFMVLLAAFEVLLFRYARQDKIVVGTPIANRSQSAHEGVIGFFANTLVLCTAVEPGLAFRELLARVRDTTLGAYAHQDLPFEKLVSELQPERSLGHNPLFQVMFTFQNLPAERPCAGEAAAERAQAEVPAQAAVPAPSFRYAKFDLTLAMTETEEGLSAVFEYATDLFEPATIERMAGHFQNVLGHVLARPGEPIAACPLLSEGERRTILERWNATDRAWPERLPLHGRFERRVREAPDATALVFRGEALTYGEIDQRAAAVAARLRRRGVGRGDVVGICLHRSVEMVAGLLGILKAGAAYMPIEPDYPEARVGAMLADARARQVLTTAGGVAALAAHGIEAIALDALDSGGSGGALPPPAAPEPDEPAYVLFTSGSTGRPKGVVISHGAIDNRLQWMQEAYGLTAADRVLQKTPYTFDVSVWEFFWPLSIGACLVVAEPGRHKESGYLVELIRRERVTCLHFVPSMLALFLHEDLSACKSLSRIICSGEALSIEQCRRLQAMPGVRAHNLYGPTEAAVDVTHYDCADFGDHHASVPIGRPISNTQIYILDERLEPQPIGVPGELYIGGDNLALGYVSRPGLTASRFVASPFGRRPGARLYRTGDLARLRSDGNIEYIGRIDSQVKLRGLRIELGEIESVLTACPGIAEAAVAVHRFGELDERLAAYVVLADPGAALDAGAVTAFLARHLPSYMIPASIASIPALPLSPNGKLDRARLPAPSAAAVRTAAAAAAAVVPVGELEETLLGIWRRLLKVEALGATDDFFALGGHSILATQVVNSINAHYHLDAPVRLLFEHPTVRALARALREHADQAMPDLSGPGAAALLRSDLHLLQTLEQATEAELDELLARHADDPRLQRFDDVGALLAWARTYPAPVRGADRTLGRGPDGAADEPADEVAAFWRCYAELSGIRTAAAIGAAPADALRAERDRIFERYARAVQRRLAGVNGVNGVNGAPGAPWAMSPAELAEQCGRMIVIADLAASIGAP